MEKTRHLVAVLLATQKLSKLNFLNRPVLPCSTSLPVKLPILYFHISTADKSWNLLTLLMSCHILLYYCLHIHEHNGPALAIHTPISMSHSGHQELNTESLA